MIYTSVFDMLKIGIGPSSSHTLGPWKAGLRFLKEINQKVELSDIIAIKIKLYGSLALTGKGHGTDFAVMLGLTGYKPSTIPLEYVNSIPREIQNTGLIFLGQTIRIPFQYDKDIEFHKDISLDYHPNGMTFQAFTEDAIIEESYFSIGGGFIVKENEDKDTDEISVHSIPYPFVTARELKNICTSEDKTIHEVALSNEKEIRSEEEITHNLYLIWSEMLQSIYRGCHTSGILPGGLDVRRRASIIYNKLTQHSLHYTDAYSWIDELRKLELEFTKTVKWISCFALAVNEENAAYSRIVTAPTNGAAGVIPAVLLYAIAFAEKDKTFKDVSNFLLTAATIGAIFKNGSTISAAQGGCQAEIGVSSAMAAAGLTEFLGGTADQAMVAAEIAMEHHLGLTCDPVNGLVQIPCIERNSMGAIKAITATHMALDTDPNETKVSLDSVIKTMWETALDMNSKYKETSLGGLATNIAVSVPEC